MGESSSDEDDIQAPASGDRLAPSNKMPENSQNSQKSQFSIQSRGQGWMAISHTDRDSGLQYVGVLLQAAPGVESRGNALISGEHFKSWQATLQREGALIRARKGEDLTSLEREHLSLGEHEQSSLGLNPPRSVSGQPRSQTASNSCQPSLTTQQSGTEPSGVSDAQLCAAALHRPVRLRPNVARTLCSKCQGPVREAREASNNGTTSSHSSGKSQNQQRSRSPYNGGNSYHNPPVTIIPLNRVPENDASTTTILASGTAPNIGQKEQRKGYTPSYLPPDFAPPSSAYIQRGQQKLESSNAAVSAAGPGTLPAYAQVAAQSFKLSADAKGASASKSTDHNGSQPGGSSVAHSAPRSILKKPDDKVSPVEQAVEKSQQPCVRVVRRADGTVVKYPVVRKPQPNVPQPNNPQPMQQMPKKSILVTNTRPSATFGYDPEPVDEVMCSGSEQRQTGGTAMVNSGKPLDLNSLFGRPAHASTSALDAMKQIAGGASQQRTPTQWALAHARKAGDVPTIRCQSAKWTKAHNANKPRSTLASALEAANKNREKLAREYRERKMAELQAQSRGGFSPASQNTPKVGKYTAPKVEKVPKNSPVVQQPSLSTSDKKEKIASKFPPAADTESDQKAPLAKNKVESEKGENGKDRGKLIVRLKRPLAKPAEVGSATQMTMSPEASTGAKAPAPGAKNQEPGVEIKEPPKKRRSAALAAGRFWKEEGKESPVSLQEWEDHIDEMTDNSESAKNANSAKKKRPKMAPAPKVEAEGSADEGEFLEVEPTEEENPLGLKPGDMVWAKMESEPWWPAEIYSFNPNAVACVLWIGCNLHGFCKIDSLERFDELFERRYNPKRANRSGYHHAVADAVKTIIERAGGATVDFYEAKLPANPAAYRRATGRNVARGGAKAGAVGKRGRRSKGVGRSGSVASSGNNTPVNSGQVDTGELPEGDSKLGVEDAKMGVQEGDDRGPDNNECTDVDMDTSLGKGDTSMADETAASSGDAAAAVGQSTSTDADMDLTSIVAQGKCLTLAKETTTLLDSRAFVGRAPSPPLAALMPDSCPTSKPDSVGGATAVPSSSTEPDTDTVMGQLEELNELVTGQE